jgi:hypothetical protein
MFWISGSFFTNPDLRSLRSNESIQDFKESIVFNSRSFHIRHWPAPDPDGKRQMIVADKCRSEQTTDDSGGHIALAAGEGRS